MKPIINNIPAFDAKKGTTGYFIVNAPITSLDLIITDKDDTSIVVYSEKIDNPSNKFTILPCIPASQKLLNNNSYLLKIITHETDGNSFESDPVIIKCIETPTFNLLLNETLVDGEYTLRGSILDVGVEYLHESEELNYYYVVLENIYEKPKESNYVYDKTKHIKINDLKDDATYEITAYGQTVNGMNIVSSTIIKTSFVKNETFVMLKASNNYKNACVDINTNIKNVLYKLEKGDETKYYSDSENIAVDLSDNVLEYYDGFTLYNTFSIFLEYCPTSNKELVLNLNNEEVVLVYGLESSKPYFEFRYNGKILIIKKDREGNALSVGNFYIIVYRNDTGEIKIDIKNK